MGRERPHPEKGGEKYSFLSQMVRKQEKYVGQENLVDHDAYFDVVLARAGGAQFVHGLFESKRLMEESHEVDMDYRHFLLSILTLDEKFGPVNKRKETSTNVIENDNDCYIEEENDPQYELFLKNLKEHERSYVFQFERAGSPGVIKYEMVPDLNLTPRKSKKEVKNLKVEAGKRSTSEMVPDLDYLAFLRSAKFVNDYFVFTFGGGTMVYEKNDMENNQEKENSDDEHSSDVEILDVAAFYKERKSKPSVNASPEVSEHMMNEDIFLNLRGQTMQSGFRQELATVLRKPYDREEHNKLLQDLKIRKPEDRHMDLRGGRERSCATAKVGKSYMDRYPGLQKQLLKFQDDGPKCLNLLRGFFFWLQKFLQEGSFEPWKDVECLAISPEVRHPGFSPKRRRKI